MKYQITTLLPLLLIVLGSSAEARSTKECAASGRSANSYKHHSHRHHHSSHTTTKHHHSSSHKSTSSVASKATTSVKSGSTNNDATDPTTSSSSSSSSSSSTTSSATSTSSLTPNGMKAGLAGGDSLAKMQGSISWLTTWTPNPYAGTDLGDVKFASMAWGIGQVDHDDDAARWAEFKEVKYGTYPYVIGFNEPDYSGEGSSGVISTADAAAAWDTYIAPHGAAGSVLISPSCAKQADETWLEPFLNAVKTQPDVINVHIFKNEASQITAELDHFAKYGKPMWITEIACIDYSSGTQYCTQAETDTFITEAIKILEADSRVMAYAWSDAYNGPQEKLTTNGSTLSATGTLLKSVVSSFAKRGMVTKRESSGT